MPAPWTEEQNKARKDILLKLYVKQNKTIGEIAQIYNCNYVTIYDQLKRLGIPTQRHLKYAYNNQRHDVIIPKRRSANLAEFIGIMLGDGHLAPTQVTVTLGTKDDFTDYIIKLVKKVFDVEAKITMSHGIYTVVYFGSTLAVKWLLKEGLVFNKVQSQVGIPKWIFSRPAYVRAALRGLLDTDGSIYLLTSGRIQISFTNLSLPLLEGVRELYLYLGLHPSKVSGKSVFLTRKNDIDRLIREVGFSNLKHRKRYERFVDKY